MARKDFHHPFQPYDIQQQFMQAVYDCIEDGKVGIFESPTGTGKSLSLLCGSLTWLREHKRRRFDESLQDLEIDDGEPQWLVKHHQESRRKEAFRLRADYEQRLEEVRRKEDSIKQQVDDRPGRTKKQKRDDPNGPANHTGDDDDQFLVDHYESDAEHEPRADGGDAYSADTLKLLKSLGLLQDSDAKASDTEVTEEVKVFFCSRTHSQLSQSVGELRRIRLPNSLPPDDQGNAAVEDFERVKQIALGSRKNLCINPQVRKLESQSAINERCLELQQASSKQKCKFLPKQDTAALTLDFRDHALSRIRDIEDIALIGEKLGVCPYYASRAAVGPAEIVTLPYPLLLQRSAREAMGLSLRGHVIIIDEAHNLLDAVESTHACQITNEQLYRARESLMGYVQKFRTRLKGSNRTYLAQIIRVIDSLVSAVQSLVGISGELSTQALLQGKGIDQINLAKLARYINDSKLARKLEGYALSKRKKEAASSRTSDNAEANPETPTLTILQNFIVSLINPTAEGRFFWDRSGSKTTLRYLLLDPTHHFRDIVEESRAIILAGGTMSPMEDIIQQLLPYLTDVRTLSCGHIVPPSSLLVRAVSGDDAGSFEFNYKTRQDQTLIRRLGVLLNRIASNVHGGLVVFFSSYAYLELVRSQWTIDGTQSDFESKKAVFFDSRTVPAEQTFQRYSDIIHGSHAAKGDGKNGAMLFSVIGGKLSEGINFSDELGRCVVVVGMPFPNLETPEWKAKLSYLEQRSRQNKQQPDTTRGALSKEYAENICMRAVNQAVGRVIRHRQDWASILLLDARYSQARVQKKLSAWIQSSLPSHTSTAKPESSTTKLCQDLKTFFEEKQAV